MTRKTLTLQDGLEMVVGKRATQRMILAERQREAERWFEENREKFSKDHKIKVGRMLNSLANKRGFKVDAKKPNDCIYFYRIPVQSSPNYLVGMVDLLDISLLPEEKYTSKPNKWCEKIAKNTFFKFYIEPTFELEHDWDEESTKRVLGSAQIIFREPVGRIAKPGIERSLTIEGGAKRFEEFIKWYKSVISQYAELSQIHREESVELKRKQKEELGRYYTKIGKGKHPGFNRGMFRQASSEGVGYMTLS